jgi:integrase
MASVYEKRTVAGKKLYYISFKDVDGTWRDRNSHCPTKKTAEKLAVKGEERVAQGLPFFIDEAEEGTEPTFAERAKLFIAKLDNRSKNDDISRMDCHLIPKWGATPLSEIGLAEVMLWIDEMKAGTAPVAKVDKESGKRVLVPTKLSQATMRHNMNLLSRVFSWAVARGYATINPVRQVPRGERPRQTPKSGEGPWLEDETMVGKLMDELPEPFDLMFYLGNRCGARTGEIVGLRMSDFDFVGDGVIRVRFSYDGPLKEDNDESGKVKWVPAPEDLMAVLGPWLAKRREQGAGSEDFVFYNPLRPRGRHARAPRPKWISVFSVEAQWEPAAYKLGVPLTWYQATRHSFTSRCLKNGAALDEVSAALGHSSPVVTRRFYDHFLRKTFSPVLRLGVNRA